jgi:hypothetical protein
MSSRFARTFVALAAALVAWLVASPAHASAPLCDPRGATVIAPAPQLQAPQTVLDAAAPAPSDDGTCEANECEQRGWEHGRVPVPEARGSSSDGESLASRSAGPAIETLFSGLQPRPDDGAAGERSGERVRVDRPPRG